MNNANNTVKLPLLRALLCYLLFIAVQPLAFAQLNTLPIINNPIIIIDPIIVIQKPTVSITTKDAVASENNDSASFTVTASFPNNQTSSITASIAINGTATNGSDYEHLSLEKVTLYNKNITPDLPNQATFTINAINDTLIEDTETIQLSIINHSSYTISSNNSAVTLSIIDNDTSPLTLSPSSPSLYAGQNLSFKAAGGTPPYTWASSDKSIATITNDGTLNAIHPGKALISVFDSRKNAKDTVVEVLPVPPTINITAPDNSAAEPNNPGQFLITLNQPPSNANLTVFYNISGTATNGTDYTTLATSVTFTPNETTKTIQVNPLADANYTEGNETVTLSLEETRTYVFDKNSSATVTIADAIEPLPVATISASDANAAEANNSGEFIISLNRAPGTNGLTVRYLISGTASNGTDYTTLATSVTFTPNETTKTIQVNPLADANYTEGNETVILTLEVDSAYTLGNSTRATISIVDAIEPLPSISLIVTDNSISEPSDTGKVSLRLSQAISKPVSVTLNIKGSAIAGVDYVELNKTLNFTAGETERIITISPIDNNVYNSANRTIEISIEPSSTYHIGNNNQAFLTIIDNETASLPLLSLTATTNEIDETNSNAVVYTITSTQAFSAPTTINYRLANTSTVTLPSDGIVSPSLGTVTINEGESTASFSFRLVDDAIYEAHETLSLELVSGDGYEVGVNHLHTLKIIDDETLTATITSNDNSALEGDEDTAQFKIALSETVLREAVTIHYTLSGTATAGTDYTLTSQSLTIETGQNQGIVNLVATTDDEIEANETVILSLESSEFYLLGNNVTASATIIDTTTTPLPIISIVALDAIAAEPKSSAALLITSSQVANSTGISVNFTLSGTASDNDIEPLQQVAFIPAGKNSTSLLIEPKADSLIEDDETIIITLSASDAYQLGANKETTVVIKDDNSPVANSPNAPSSNPAPPVISIELIQGAASGSLRPQNNIAYAVRVTDQTATVIPAALITWSLNSASIEAGASITPNNSTTDSNGESQATLTTANYATTHLLTVTARITNGQNNTIVVSEAFSLTTGLSTLFTVNTAEATMAELLDSTCHNLNTATSLTEQQTSLLQYCNQFYSALASEADAELRDALRQLNPGYLPTIGKLSQRLAMNQLNNIAQHLRNSRRDSSKRALADLSLNINGEFFPLAELLSGGSAGSNDELWLDERLGYFISGKVLSGTRSANSHDRGADFDTEGLTFGLDYRLSNNTIAGIALGLADTSAAFSDQSGSFDSQGYSLALFSSHSFNDHAYVDSALSYGKTDHSIKRKINYTLAGVTTQLSPESDTHDHQIAFMLAGGYSIYQEATGLNFDLYTQINYARINLSKTNEHGADAFNFTINEHSFNSVNFALGVQLVKTLNQSWGILSPQFNLSWNKHMQDAYTVSGKLITDPSNASFHYQTEATHDSYLRIALGISAQFANGLSSFIEYSKLFETDNYNENGYNLGVRFSRTW